MTGYRFADSWRVGEKGNMPYRCCCGMAKAVGRGEGLGGGRWWGSSEDLAEFHPSPRFVMESTKVNKPTLIENGQYS
jgi:hypothetical protein